MSKIKATLVKLRGSFSKEYYAIDIVDDDFQLNYSLRTSDAEYPRDNGNPEDINGYSKECLMRVVRRINDGD